MAALEMHYESHMHTLAGDKIAHLDVCRRVAGLLIRGCMHAIYICTGLGTPGCNE